MFRRVLVANRGEIAVRVIRACKELGVRTVAVYSPPDWNHPFVHVADEAYALSTAKSYLDIEEILAVARKARADAVHPGYGFLAENPAFARACEESNITFVGPDASVLETCGNKIAARRVAASVGVPVLPASQEVGSVDAEDILNLAVQVGYPVVVKAAWGGGGRGMRPAANADELRTALAEIQREALTLFGNGAAFVEKYLPSVRHVEIQILADCFGKVIHLGERDCTIQRRHQKLIEESPSPAVSPGLRAELGEMAVRLARAVGYVGAGTVEFLMTPDNRYYFTEVNPRIQVEHPVTEAVTGVDIVKEQLKLACGEPLDRSQEDVALNGWAIECRLNAEDASRGFMPCPGRITVFNLPGGPGVRVDSGVCAGTIISTHYDSIFAKVIAWGHNRGEAIQRMCRALDETAISGIETTIPFHRWALKHPEFRRGRVDTGFVRRYWEPAEAEAAV